MTSSNIRSLAIALSGTALLAIAGVSTAMAGQAQAIANMPTVPTITGGGSYTAPRVNRACPTPRPELSEEQRHRNEQGDVVVGVYVSAYGHAKKISVAKSSGFEDLDNAAAASAGSWHYLPAMMGTANVSGWTAVKFHFAVQDSSERSADPVVAKNCT
jgi:protein TonB